MPKNSKGREVAQIIPSKCMGCQVCAGVCPVYAIDMVEGVARIDPETCVGCGKCFDACPVGAILFEKPRKKKAEVKKEEISPFADYKGVAVFIEACDGVGAEVSWELIGKGRELADKLETQVFGFLPGSGVSEVAKDAIAYGCDVVYVIDSPSLKTYLTQVYAKAMVTICEQVKPEILLMGATPLGRDLSSAVATPLGTGLTADCTGLDIDMKDRLLLMTRPTFGGNIMATIFCRDHRPQMSTVRPRVMKMPLKDNSRKGEIRHLEFEAPKELSARVIEFTPKVAGGEDIAKAPTLVVVGKGACNVGNFPMFEELARLLGGTFACTRPVVEEGALPYMRQVGQTGKTVAPKIYIGIAVSGAVQHLVGMQGSEKIIAINNDRRAPMVQIADYALVGDYVEIVPKLIEGLKARIPSIKGGGG